MPSDKPTFAANNPRWIALWLLPAGHIIAGVLGVIEARLASSDFPTSATVLLGIVFSQTSLLGIWGGLGKSRWWTRLTGVVVGVGYLFVLLGYGLDDLSVATFIVVVTATTSVAMLLLVVRFFIVALHLGSRPATTTSSVQFSIRHLLILTFLTACLVTVGKSVQPYLPSHVRFVQLLPYGITFGVAGLVPVWPVLVSRHPVLVGAGSVVAGACAGCIFGWLGKHDDTGTWTTITAIEALGVVVSLLVVRCCGYRHAVPNCESHC